MNDDTPAIVEVMEEKLAIVQEMGQTPELFVLRSEDYDRLIDWLGFEEGTGIRFHGIGVRSVPPGECFVFGYLVKKAPPVPGWADVPRAD